MLNSKLDKVEEVRFWPEKKYDKFLDLYVHNSIYLKLLIDFPITLRSNMYLV